VIVRLPLAAVLSVLASAASGQGVRINGVTTGRFVDLRPFVYDSVPRTTVVDSSGLLFRTNTGLTVTCVSGRAFCRYLRSADRISTLPVTQDVEATAWGFGTGLSAHAFVRAREALGDNPSEWPRADDRFDVLTAYLEADLDRWRARAGRQFENSALGFRNFDGVSATVRANPAINAQAYAGWGLAQGLNEPITSQEIGRFDDLPPDSRAFVVGGSLRYRQSVRTSASVEYRRDIRTDRASLYAERVALTASQLLGATSIDGVLVYDLASGVVNDGRVRGSLGLASGSSVSVELRHYQPFFELWTIWGAFSPVGYDEARGTVAWSTARTGLSVEAFGGWRRYEEAHVAGFSPEPLRGNGWNVGATVAWQAAPAWSTMASFASEIGFGASRTDADASVVWEQSRDRFIGARVSAYQTIYEFRVGTGRVFGAGVDGGIRVRPDLRLLGDVMFFHQRTTNAGPVTNWGQRRAMLRLEWTVGNDAGAETMPGSAR
jgi:hypothetical protein